MDRLTPSQKEVMEYLWEEDLHEFISTDILEDKEHCTWGKSTLSRMLKSLAKVGMIKESGTALRVKTYARKFHLAMTKMEYLSKMTLCELGSGNVVQLIDAILKESKGRISKNDIAQLREIVTEWKDTMEK